MYKHIFFVIIVLVFTFPATSFALRCDSDLVEVGDLKIEVQLACGEPLSKEVIGYVDQVRYKVEKSYTEQRSRDGKDEAEERIRVMNIEEWIVKESDNYYSLVFEGNKLKEIEWANK